jgi:hypothetical protein
VTTNPTSYLQVRGVLRPDCPLDPLETVRWPEIAGDLGQARLLGIRMPRFAAADSTRLRDECRRRLALSEPARSLGSLARRRSAPSGAEVCLLLADLSQD